MADKLAYSLDEIGSPSTAETIVEYLGLEHSIRYIKNVLSSDERFVRVTISDYALVHWGFREYSGVASSIRHLLEKSGPMQIERILDRLHADFGTVKSTARAYCDAPAFVIEDGWVRLREDGEPYVHRGAVRDAAGIFHLGDYRLGVLIRVDREVLRGSGRALSSAVGSILGIQPNDRLAFLTPNGTSLVVSFPDTSNTGPSLGSTRALATATGSRLGDWLTLVLDRGEMSVSATTTNIANHTADWELVSRLTGIRASDGLEGLAAALGCAKDEVVAVLRARGDDTVADALPMAAE